MQAIHIHDQGSRTVSHDDWRGLIAGFGYKAVVFDCDGTLVESGDAHFNAFRDAAGFQGEILDRVWYGQRTGLDRRSLLTEFSRLAGRGFEVERAVQDSIRAFENHLHLVHPVPEPARLMLDLSTELPIAVGTNAETEVARASLTATDLIRAISVIVSISDGHPPKPAPDIFVAAAAKLNSPLRSTLVVEDSEQGVQAARSAGMDVLKVLPTV